MALSPINTPTKVVCVGRNYADHAKELGNAVPETPILFIKPSTSIVGTEHGFYIPTNLGECHHECELVVQIGHTLKNASETEAKAAISGVTLGLDLTLRDLQNQLKNKGQPWERAKAFDGACVLAPMLAPEMLDDLKNATFHLAVNGTVRQQGNTADMLFDIVGLIAHISQTFTLLAGDIIMTGTPAGVAALQAGDQLALTLDTVLGEVTWKTAVLE